MIRLTPLKSIFHQDFENPTEVAKAQGVLTGSPEVNNGLFLDGSTQYASYNFPNTLLAKKQLTYVMEFTPDFDWDDNEFYGFFGESIVSTFAVVKWNSNTFSVALGTVGKYYTISGWQTGKTNTLVITIEDQSQKVYLNGSLLGSETESLSPHYLTGVFNIGYSYYNYFKGIIHSFSVYNLLFTQEDVDLLDNNSMFSFIEKSSIWLDFSSLSDGYVRDKSGKGNNFQVVSCDFLAPGLRFDGSTSYIVSPIPAPTGTFTFAYKTAEDGVFFEDNLVDFYDVLVNIDWTGSLLYLVLFEFSLTEIQKSFIEGLWSGTRG